jgi:hypothetical protein
MSASQALNAARAAGVSVRLHGNDLQLEAATPPPTALLDLLSGNKASIVELLRRQKDSWSAEDWQAYFDERAAIAEFDGGLQRSEAEAQAFECCLIEWLNLHAAPSAPGRCAHCGEAASSVAVILPFGTEPGMHTWLHSHCWPAWREARRAEAIVALASLDIRG